MGAREPGDGDAVRMTLLGHRRVLVEGLSMAEVAERLEPTAVADEEPASDRASTEAVAESTGLLAREVEVLALIGEGLSNNQIAERLYLSINSIKSYIRSIYAKLGIDSRSHAVRWALAHGLAQLDH